MNSHPSNRSSAQSNGESNSLNGYDYSNSGRPRDFDIRIEVAEQQEIVKQSQEQFSAPLWHCSEYDF